MTRTIQCPPNLQILNQPFCRDFWKRHIEKKDIEDSHKPLPTFDEGITMHPFIFFCMISNTFITQSRLEMDCILDSNNQRDIFPF